MLSFEVGKEYYMTSVCDSNCHWFYKVISRTAKTVTLQQISQHPEAPITRRISVYEDCEQVMPEGRYSMAPVLRASREVMPSEPESEVEQKETQQPTASVSSTNVIDFAAYREAKEAKREAEAELQYFITYYLPYVTPQEAEEIVTAQEEARQVEILRKICNRIDGERSRV